jgi:hypothetical protein
MSLGKKLDVEPLSEQRWSRIERDLFDRVDRGEVDASAPTPSAHVEAAPRWRMSAALVLAGAVAAIGGAAAWHALAPPRTMATAPSRITTEGAGSHVSVGEASLDLAPQSTVFVSGDDARGVTVLLERGRVELEVPPRLGRPPFVVEAGDVHVRVVGTHFAVARSAADVVVEVQRGVVEVSEGADHVDVHSGERWPMATPATSVASSAPTATSSASTDAIPTSATTSNAAPLSASSAPTKARELYESASRLEATRPDEAISIYRDLAAKGGPWGMNALFAEARLEMERGHRDEARRLLRDYLARYPAGPNANDARQLLERLR